MYMTEEREITRNEGKTVYSVRNENRIDQQRLLLSRVNKTVVQCCCLLMSPDKIGCEAAFYGK